MFHYFHYSLFGLAQTEMRFLSVVYTRTNSTRTFRPNLTFGNDLGSVMILALTQ